jgi:hypothetical protein
MVEQGLLDVKAMIPEKWFDFGEFDNYQACFNPPRWQLTVVRNQIISVQSDELSDSRTIHQKAPDFMSVFRAAHELRDLTVTEVRLDNFAEKRQEKRSFRPTGPPTSAVTPEWVGPPLPPLTTEEFHRIASISDPAKSSAGSRLFYATQEKDSELLATLFCKTVITLLFWEDLSLKWVIGRNKRKPVLRWRHRLNSRSCHILTYSALAAEVKIGDERIGARTDGGLQIFLPREGSDSLVAWDRSYYEIAFEVNIPLFLY